MSRISLSITLVTGLLRSNSPYLQKILFLPICQIFTPDNNMFYHFPCQLRAPAPLRVSLELLRVLSLASKTWVGPRTSQVRRWPLLPTVQGPPGYYTDTYTHFFSKSLILSIIHSFIEWIQWKLYKYRFLL